MLNVSDITKNAYLSDNYPKTVTISFPELNLHFSNSDIKIGTFKVKEGVMDGEDLSFVGCIASTFEVTIEGLKKDVRGKQVEVVLDVEVEGSETDSIYLFHGIVDSCKKQTKKYEKAIVAYDMLYSLSNINAADWYNAQTTETTLGDFITSFLSNYSIPFSSELITHPMASMPAYGATKRTVSDISVLDVMKQICQLFGGWGIINREGVFDIKYPLNTTVASDATNSSVSDIVANHFTGYTPPVGTTTLVPYTKSNFYEEYKVNAITKVVIRNTSKDTGVTVGSGKQIYYVQGNIFCYDQTDEILTQLGYCILERVREMPYVPFDANINGLPFLECGDEVAFYEDDGTTISEKNFVILNRTMSGVVGMRDEINAEGEENQRFHISDLSASVSDVEKQQDEIQDQVDDIQDQITDVSDKMLKAVSVADVPTNWDENTIYFIRE